MSERNKALKVAQFANPRKPGLTKAELRLASRTADYHSMTGRHDFKAPHGAFHKPGALK